MLPPSSGMLPPSATIDDVVDAVEGGKIPIVLMERSTDKSRSAAMSDAELEIEAAASHRIRTSAPTNGNGNHEAN